jgi:hypothetical protein
MGSISRANVRDALVNKPRDRVVIVETDGQRERRIVKRPEGRIVEQWVDRQGNVVWIPLLLFGTPQGIEAADRKRAELRREGFVEYHKCPILHGAHVATPQLEDAFTTLPHEHAKACTRDPIIHERRGQTTFVNEPCPHIAWLIEDRRARARQEAAARATRIETQADLEKQKIALAEQQLAEQREMNRRLIDVIEKGGLSERKKGKPDA